MHPSLSPLVSATLHSTSLKTNQKITFSENEISYSKESERVTFTLPSDAGEGLKLKEGDEAVLRIVYGAKLGKNMVVSCLLSPLVLVFSFFLIVLNAHFDRHIGLLRIDLSVAREIRLRLDPI